MRISEVIATLRAERLLMRTPRGRSLTDYAINNLDAALSDTKNHEQNAIQCKNCGLITSSLLVPEGCNGCGSKDLTTDINRNEIIKGVS